MNPPYPPSNGLNSTTTVLLVLWYIHRMHTGWSSVMYHSHRQFRVFVHQISSRSNPDQHPELLRGTPLNEKKTLKNLLKSRTFIWWNPSQYQPMRNLNSHILCMNYEFRFFQFFLLSHGLYSQYALVHFVREKKIASVLPFSAIYNRFCCILICRCMHKHNDAMKTRQFLEKYTSHSIWKVCMWEGVGDRTELQHIDPHSYGHQRFFPVIQGCSTGGPGDPASAGCCFLYSIISPSLWSPKLVEFPVHWVI